MDLIQELERIRVRNRLTNAQFAAKLGISQNMWMKTKAGQREVGPALLRGVARNYPELWDDVRAYYEQAVA